jgi:transposase-like protein
MGRKAKYTFEQKRKAVEEYLTGEKSAAEIACELEMRKGGETHVRTWAKLYQANGPDSLKPRLKNSSYTKAFKEQVVQDYVRGRLSLNELMAKYNISSGQVIRSWIKKYNNHIELEDYDPHPEVYMAERKKTTKEERLEIVQYCLEHNKNYRSTAARYGCSYSQVYDWVRRYNETGEDGLEDRRGKHKTEEQLSDLEKAERKNKQLEERIKRLEVENEFLKKLNAIKRGW